MKRRLKELAILIAVLAVIGLVVMVSGVVPVKASSGHWAVTQWVLDFASTRSISFHSRGIEVPPLHDDGMVILGSATFESNCQFCHGHPGRSQPPVARGMTPTPPLLSKSVPEMNSQELFYVVKHGVKFAGMPAWPTQLREDEIWPVVAFLNRYPDLSHEEFRELVEPIEQTTIDSMENESSQSELSEIEPSQTESSESEQSESEPTEILGLVARRCAACHGLSGNGRAGDRVPHLAGQNEVYLRQTLLAYRSGERVSGVMMPVAHRLSDDEIHQLASYFARQDRSTRRAPDSKADESLIDRGRKLADLGDRSEKIPSCVDCHGPSDAPRADDYPTLAGLPARYLQQQLELFSKRHRGGTENASLMHPIADKLSDEQRAEVAAYYQSLQ